MSPSRPFIERPVATSLFMAAIFLAGIVAFKFLPISALPEVDYPTIQVTTSYPGASPEVVATSVTAPLEVQFGQMTQLDRMSSISSGGSSVVTLQFDLSLPLDVAEQEVQGAINAAQSLLPTTLPAPPIYAKINPADAPVLTLALTSTTMPLTQVEYYANQQIGQKISQLSGVGLVSISGGQKPAVRIEVNTQQLASYGLSMSQVSSAVASANANGAKGAFDGPTRSYSIDANDELLTPTDYANQIIAYTNNAPVRLSDVARVVDGAENTQLGAWYNRTPAVLLNVQRQPGANVISTVDKIKKALPDFLAAVPSGINLTVVTDRTTGIRASVEDVEFELLLSVLLVVLVIFVFLRSLQATFIASVAVPLSLVGTFGVMYLLGYSLNNLTLMAMTIATGFVVDDAIVMIENISRYIEAGEEPMAAAIKGASQIGFTIISLTVSLIAVLIPLLFMGDVVGRLFRQFAVTLAVTIVISAIVSLTLVPTLSARWLRPTKAVTRENVFSRRSKAIIDGFIHRYDLALIWVLDRQLLTLAIATATFVITVILFLMIPKGLFPTQDTGLIQGVVQAGQSVSYDAMAKLQQDVDDEILKDPDVASLTSFIGVDGVNTTLDAGRTLINLKPLGKRGSSLPRVLDRLRTAGDKVPGATLYVEPVQDLTVDASSGRTQYQFALQGSKTETVAEWSQKLVARLAKEPKVRDVASDLQDQGLATYVDINRDSAARVGVTPSSIDAQLYYSFGQSIISTIFTQAYQERVILEADPTTSQTPAALSDLYVNTPSGSPTPLRSLATIETRTEPLQINHVGQFPAANISFDTAPGVALGDAVNAIQKDERAIKIPNTITTVFLGSANAFKASIGNELWLILAAIVVVYIVLGVLYESYVHPITILSTLPSAGAGALAALMLAGQDLGVIGIIGIILLIGIVKKNAIMMIDFALDAERVEGKSPREAIHQAALLRFRPIIMTTMAALFGALPLMLGWGVGSELRHPLGISIVGGLIVSQALTLFTTPVIYLQFDWLSRRLGGENFRKGEADPNVSEAEPDPGPVLALNLSEPFIRRPIATILLTLGVALAGIGAFFLLPVSPLPELDIPTIFVQAGLPGASPETMATSVATPLERHLGVISDVTELTSTSRVGQSTVVMTFDLGRNIDGAARDVEAGINATRADLPLTLRSNPTYRKVNPSAAPILILALTSKTRTPGQIYDAAETVIQQQISQVKGVGEVDLGGSSLPAVRVDLNPLELSRDAIGLEDVRAALASANANQPKGVVQSNGQRYQIYTNDTGFTAADYAPLVIAYRNGAAVRLSDVASVTDSVESIHNIGLFNGQPAVVVVVRGQPGANIVQTADGVKALIPTLEKILPPDIDWHLALDRTLTIRASLADVETTALISIVLVVAVVAFFLHNGRAILIPSVAISVSLLGAIAVMFLLGFSLDNLSLMALTVATGFVVDDAIVVLENITRHVEAGMNRFDAALQGAREVGFTVLSISISLVAVFLPILLMGGIVGRLFREFAVTLSAAVLVSLVVSLTTTPMMSAYLIDARKPNTRPGRMVRMAEAIFGRMQSTYEKALDWALESGPLMLIVLVVCVILTGYLFGVVQKGFFPTEDTGVLQGGLRTDQSSSFALTKSRLKQLVNIVDHDPSVATVVAFAGNNASGGFLLASLKPRNQQHGGAEAVVARLRPKLARVVGVSLFLNPAQDIRAGGRSSNATYQYTIEGESLASVRLWAGKLAEALKRQPKLADVNTDQEDHGLEGYITIDKDRAAALHMTDTNIDNNLYDEFGERQVSTIYQETNQYHIIMEAAPPFTQDPTDLQNVYMSNGGAATSPTSPIHAVTAVGAAGATSATGVPAAAGSTAQGAPSSTAVVGAPSQTSVQGAPAEITPAAGGAASSAAAAITSATPNNAPLAVNAAGVPGGVSATAGTDVAVGVAAVKGPGAPAGRAASQGVAVSTTAEQIVPLKAFATWADQATPTAVNHQDTEPATTISFNLPPGASLSDATKAIDKAAAEIDMPASIHGSFAGTAKVFEQSLAYEPVLILAALVAIYIVLGVLYESYVHPLTVLSTLPSAGTGALIALILFHIQFDIIGLIGIILLIGIVKKNAIMMIDFALSAQRDEGLSPYHAIRQAALTQFRPIMMTTFAAMFGALPLAIGWGDGSELRRPLGVTIVGGLLVSQFITLLTTPVVYLYLDRLTGRGRRAHAADIAGPEPVPAS